MPRKAVSYTILLLLPFALAEGGARLALWGYERWINPFEERQFARDSVVTRRNVYLRYDFVKGRAGYVSYDHAEINALGFRGRPFDRVKAPGELRIACLGNSVTFGWGVPADSLAYPARLERWLAVRHPDRTVRVVNAGMPRFNSHDILGVLIHKVVPVQPDVAVILSGWNDLEDAIVEEGEPSLPAGLYLSGSYLAIDRVLSWLSARSAFVNLFRKGVVYLAERLPPGKLEEAEYDELVRALERLPKTDRIDPAGLATFRRALETTIAVCRRHGIAPALLTWPHFFHDPLTTPEKRVLLPHLLKFPHLSYAGWRRVVDACNTVIREVAAAEGVVCLDVERIADYTYFKDAVHLTPAGYDLLARRVAEGLDAQGLIGPKRTGQR
jgi:lysophospholipase L1-like esterase